VRGTYGEALVSVTRNRNLRLAQLSSVSTWTGEFLFVTAMTVYAFDRDGAAGVGVIGFLRVLPATVALPWFGALADRMSRRWLLVGTSMLRAITAAAAGVAAAAGLPIAAYALITVSTVCHAAYRPVLAALLPSLCTTPDELAGANAIRSVLDGLAALVGPLAAAALLASASPAAAFAVVAALAVVGGLLAAALRYESAPAAGGNAEPARVGVLGELIDGLRELRRSRRAAIVIELGAAQCVVRGALTVLAVVLAVDLTDMGRPGVGVLWAAFGVGSFVAATASIGAAGSTRLGTLFGLGVTMWGVPVIVSGLLLHSYVAVGVFAIVGAANALVDIAGFTLLQRLVPDHMLARVLGLTEAVFALSVAVGSLVIPLVISVLGDTGAFLLIGCLPPLAVAARYVALRGIDSEIGVRSDRIALLRRVGMLRLLPVPAIESLALHLQRSRVAAGADVFRQGDPGDGYYVIESGRVAVVEDGRDIRELGPGDSFGEIALLRSVPRTATVRALGDAEFVVISGPRFIAAVSGFSATSSSADEIVNGYFADDIYRRETRRRSG
jgi:MFS family permease